MNVVVLDCDGVINRHRGHPNGYCGTDPECVDNLNRILHETGANVVLSSAWRYLAWNGNMTLKGLENLFLTHGLDIRDRLIGMTDWDHWIWDRGDQISAWLRDHPEVERYCVLDDGGEDERAQNYDLGMQRCGHPHVWTYSSMGLTADDARRAIAILGEPEPCT